MDTGWHLTGMCPSIGETQIPVGFTLDRAKRLSGLPVIPNWVPLAQLLPTLAIKVSSVFFDPSPQLHTDFSSGERLFPTPHTL